MSKKYIETCNYCGKKFILNETDFSSFEMKCCEDLKLIDEKFKEFNLLENDLNNPDSAEKATLLLDEIEDLLQKNKA